MCPSCGPAQGYNPEFEALCEWFDIDVLTGISDLLDTYQLAEEIINRLGSQPDYVIEAIKRRMHEWNAESAALRRDVERGQRQPWQS